MTASLRLVSGGSNGGLRPCSCSRPRPGGPGSRSCRTCGIPRDGGGGGGGGGGVALGRRLGLGIPLHPCAAVVTERIDIDKFLGPVRPEAPAAQRVAALDLPEPDVPARKAILPLETHASVL